MGVHKGASRNSMISEPLLRGRHEISQPCFRHETSK